MSGVGMQTKVCTNYNTWASFIENKIFQKIRVIEIVIYNELKKLFFCLDAQSEIPASNGIKYLCKGQKISKANFLLLI